MEKYNFMVDWISVRIDCPSVNEWFDLLYDNLLSEFDVISSCKPRRLYQYGYCLNGKRIFSFELSIEFKDDNCDCVYMKGKDEAKAFGILVEFSGDGLRYFGFDKVINFLNICTEKYTYHFTRFDVACDITDNSNSIIPAIILAAENKLSFSPEGIKIYKARKVQIYNNSDIRHKCISKNVDIGTRGGNFCRVYDKQLEQFEKGYMPLEDIPDYWYRIELEIRPGSLKDGFRPEYSNDVYINLKNNVDIAEIFLTHLTRFFDLRECRGIYEERSDYTVDCVAWVDFVELIKTIILCNNGENPYKSYLEYYSHNTNFDGLQHYFNYLVSLLLLCDRCKIGYMYDEFCRGISEGDEKYRKYRSSILSSLKEQFPDLDYNKLRLINPFGYNSKVVSSSIPDIISSRK